MTAPEVFDIRLASSRNLTPSVRELVFERVDGRAIDFQPGQWVNLVLPLPSGELKRAYSIASAPGSARFELAVTKVTGGPASEFLHGLADRTTLRAIGPQGLFTRSPDDHDPSLFVATGTGVTPLRSMMQAALNRSPKAPLWLLFGARREEDILYRDEFQQWAQMHPRVRYEITLSQASASWAGRRGYVQEHVSQLFSDLRAKASPHAPHVYVCGLERMVKIVRELVREKLGADRKHVHSERYD